jgi:hypothetical protein
MRLLSALRLPTLLSAHRSARALSTTVPPTAVARSLPFPVYSYAALGGARNAPNSTL